jgi:hypothetical protein
MKRIIIILSFIMSISSNGQKFANTEWIQVAAANRDGSKIIDYSKPGTRPTKYYFDQESVSISINEQYSTHLKYSVSDSVLLIGEFIKLKIDSISDPVIIVSDIPRKGIVDDRLYTFMLLNTDYLFDYLKQNEQIEIVGDSLIICNSMFSPTYSGDLSELFRYKYTPDLGKETITGVFTISKEGNMTDIEITSDIKHTKRGIENIAKIFKSTEGNWIMPPAPSAFKYKLSFSLFVLYERTMSGGIPGTIWAFNFVFNQQAQKK